MSDSSAERDRPPRGSALHRPRKARPGGVRHEELLADLDAQARVRRKLSERMAFELACPPSRTAGGVSELIRAKSMFVKYESTDEVLLAFPDAPRLVSMGHDLAVGFFEGPGGLVLYFHDVDELWDMVVPIRPFRDFVLLGVEDVEDVFYRLTPDSAKAISAFVTLEEALNLSLITRAELADNGLISPLHRGFSVTSSSS